MVVFLLFFWFVKKFPPITPASDRSVRALTAGHKSQIAAIRTSYVVGAGINPAVRVRRCVSDKWSLQRRERVTIRFRACVSVLYI